MKDAAWRITIRRGGPHRQTQRLERSLRSRSTFRRDAAVFCADFLYAEGCTVLDLVQPYFAGESSCAKFHWASGRNCRGNLLSIHWSFASLLLAAVLLGFGAAKLFYPRLRVAPRIGLDRSVHHIGCLPRCSVQTSPFAGLARRLQHSRAGRLDRISLSPMNTVGYSATPLAQSVASPAGWNLCDHADFGHGTTSDSSCSRDGRRHATHRVQDCRSGDCAAGYANPISRENWRSARSSSPSSGDSSKNN